MPIAELVLDSSPNDFESFYFKATDQSTSLVVLVASKNQIARLLENVGDTPGLYVLQAEDSTVYVGQSKVLGERLKTHRTNNKIGYRRVMVMLRDQSLSRYLDYGEAKLFDTLRTLGYRLDQSPLSGSLDSKRQRLTSLDKEHVAMADGLVNQFLAYSVALGLNRPVAAIDGLPEIRSSAAAPKNIGLQPSPPAAPVPVAPLPLPALKVAPVPAPDTGNRRAAKTNLWLQRRDGTALRADSGMALLKAALVEAGLTRVAALGLTISGEALVAPAKSSKYPGESHGVDQWYVQSHSSSAEKVRLIQKVSHALNLGWAVHLERTAQPADTISFDAPAVLRN